ncbi:hypothetical protein E3N88_19863 [Mikania micrantha]|uniref:Methyltransferase-like protein 5 n=1 Tax=Mikania micrantha TaxID=192012 RepID=A0A5N6NSJ1_9ASTR|nr:hypothetical protein E3N88_19863 [Mikania micrantha]
MKLKQLEGLLGNLQQFDNPKIELEQYPTGAHIASRMLYTAENSFGDISNKIVADFGCGCGTLGLAAALLDAEHVIGVDVDDESLEIASINADELEVELGLIQCEIKSLAWRGQIIDTVVMNPPFGTRKKGADMEFLSVALKVASQAVYSLHKTTTREHIKRAALRDYNASSAEVLSTEGLLFDEETTQATVVKSGVLPTLLQPRVVVYDGVCHLCHRGVKLVINADKDRRIKFCCLQSKAAEPYMRVCGVDREDVLRRFLFIEGPFEYHQGSSAALKVLSYLPLPYSALSTLMIIPTPIRDLAYDYIAKKRYDWFGKDTNCLVLKEKDLLERFIDRDETVQKEWSDE